MLWSFQLLISIWFGYESVSFLARNNFSFLERFAAGIPLGLYIYGILVFLFSYHKTLSSSNISIIIIFIFGCLFHYYNSKLKIKLNLKITLTTFQFLTYFAFSFYLFYVVYEAMLYDEINTKGACYGDLPFHLNIISAFATGINYNRSMGLFDIFSVFYKGEKLAYPFLTNYISAIFLATGKATLRASLLFPSLFVVFSLIISMYSLFSEFNSNKYVIFLCFLLFMNLGGNGWIKWTGNYQRDANFVHDWGNGQYEFWFHPIMHYLIPQRASLFSLPLCLWCYISIIRANSSRNTISNSRESNFLSGTALYILAALFVGLTPLIQVHSYVTLAQWTLTFALITFPWKDKTKWPEFIIKWGVFGILANIIAIPQLYPYIGRLKKNVGGFGRFKPIWDTPDRKYLKFRPFVLWWRGLGPFAAISLIFGLPFLSKKQWRLYIPSLVVFIFANFIRYQPWELDNTKMFYNGWIPFALPITASYLETLIFAFSSNPHEKVLKHSKPNSSSQNNNYRNDNDNNYDNYSIDNNYNNINNYNNNNNNIDNTNNTNTNNNNSNFCQNIYIRLFMTLIGIVLLIACQLSSIYHSFDCLMSKPFIFDHQEYQIGLWIMENTSPKAVFLTSEWHAHPAGTIAGRQLMLGYSGWVSSHGLDYGKRWFINTHMLDYPNDIKFFRENEVEYVISRYNELQTFESQRDPKKWAIVYRDNILIIYQLRKNAL